MWDDVKWGTSHVRGWGRVALVTDVDWMRHLTKAFSWLAPKGMKVFPTDRARRGEGVGGWLSDIEMINAVTLVTADMETSSAFYMGLGFEPIVGGRRRCVHDLPGRRGFLNVQLDPTHAPIVSIWGRVIFWVADVDAMYERALAHGIAPEMAPIDAPWGERYFHLRDPDGHELSFAKLLAPVELSRDRAARPSRLSGVRGTIRWVRIPAPVPKVPRAMWSKSVVSRNAGRW